MDAMIKKRIIPKFLIKDGRLVKGERFHFNFREAGNPATTAKVYNAYGVDELILLDIHAGLESRKAVIDIIARISREVFMPLTVGGGITTLEDIHALFKAGADKVSMNTAAVENPALVKEAALRFGDQCMTVSIDYARQADGSHKVLTHGGTQLTDLDPVDWACRMQDCHCGEILLTSIDRDGTMSGYDLDMIHAVSQRLNVPLIASSGAGSLKDCVDAFRAGADAITISSMFFFTDHSPIKVRSYLHMQGLNVRASRNSRN